MGGRGRERAAPAARRDEVRPDVAERVEPAVGTRDRGEPTEPAARDVLEEDALDRLLGAEREHLLVARLDDHPRILAHASRASD